MKEYEKEIMTRANWVRGLRWFLPVLLALFATACATTGSQFGASSDAQAASGQTGKSACQSGKTAASQQGCQHHGVIEIVEDHPVDPEIKDEFQQAVALLKQEKYPDAIRLLKTVTGKTSKFSAPFIDLGIAYARTNEYDKAEESLKKALAINALHPVALNELGLVYRKTGRYSEARKLYEKLLQTYPDYLPAHKNLGVLCDIYMKDLNCALQQYETYVQARPEDQKVKIWIADVKSRM